VQLTHPAGDAPHGHRPVPWRAALIVTSPPRRAGTTPPPVPALAARSLGPAPRGDALLPLPRRSVGRVEAQPRRRRGLRA
jgi:hypothetical protein